MKYFFRMYLLLALKVYSRMLIDSLCFMGVDKIKKHLLGFIQSKYSPLPSVLTIPSAFNEYTEGHASIFDFVYHYRCS